MESRPRGGGNFNERVSEMKIEAGTLQPIIMAGQGSSSQVSQDQGFEALLRNTCRTRNDVRFDGRGSNAGEILEAGRPPDVKLNEETAVLRAEKVLDILDLYRGKLGDIHTPLQDIRPLIGELHQAAEDLDSALGQLRQGLGAGDVTREISILAHREIRRYRENGFSANS
jgi:hypothetical protein